MGLEHLVLAGHLYVWRNKMTDFEQAVKTAAEKAVLQFVQGGQWLQPNYESRLKIPAEWVADCWRLVDAEKLKRKCTTPPTGPCLCGATDCPSCGPAQGYILLDSDAREAMIQSDIAEKRASLAAVVDALGSFTDADFQRTDALVFEALDSEQVDKGIPQDKLAAIGEHLVNCVLRIFDEQAREDY